METADALVETIQSLWPGAEVELTRDRRTGKGAQAQFAMVPNRRSPRLLVPADDARAAARALWRFNAAAPPRETWGRAAMAALVRGGGLAAFPDRIRVHGSSEGSLADHLAGLLGQPVRFSLGIGTARVNRKPVLQLFSATEARAPALGFVKLGNSAQARADVRAEAASLARLTGRPWRTLVTPQLVHHGQWGDVDVLLMSALDTDPWQRPAEQWRVPHDAMAELTGAFGEQPRPLAALPWVEGLRTAAGRLEDPQLGAELAEAVDVVVDLAGTTPWAVGAWHGDWTPWNMVRHRGRVHLWDWERFETGVPQGLDPFHYFVNTVTRRDGTSPESIQHGLELAGAPRADRSSPRHQLAATYLLAAAGRYLPLISAEEGRHIADRARQTLDALWAWTRGRTGSARS